MCDQDHYEDDRKEYETRGLVTRWQFGVLVGAGITMMLPRVANALAVTEADVTVPTDGLLLTVDGKRSLAGSNLCGNADIPADPGRCRRGGCTADCTSFASCWTGEDFMVVRRVAADSWTAELDGFSRRHEGWLVSVTTRTADGRTAVGARNLPLLGVSRVSLDSNDIAIAVGDQDRHLTHDVHDAIALRVELTADLVERALVIDTSDGSTTSVEFRSPVRVEEVDGLPAPRG